MTSAARPPLSGRLNTLVIGGRMEADRAVLLPRGELVHGCADALAEKLAGLPASTARVDVDMSGVHFMDTAALQFLDVLRDYGRRHRLPVTATRWNGQPRRILELAGLDTSDPLSRPEPGGGAAGGAARQDCSAVARERAEQLHLLQEEIEQLRHAIASRPVIDQARGILMATHGCTSQEAWHVLRKASQSSNTKLRTVAAAVIAGTRADGPRPPEAIRQALARALARHAS